jgi:hypothetical protein
VSTDPGYRYAEQLQHQLQQQTSQLQQHQLQQQQQQQHSHPMMYGRQQDFPELAAAQYARAAYAQHHHHPQQQQQVMAAAVARTQQPASMYHHPMAGMYGFAQAPALGGAGPHAGMMARDGGAAARPLAAAPASSSDRRTAPVGGGHTFVAVAPVPFAPTAAATTTVEPVVDPARHTVRATTHLGSPMKSPSPTGDIQQSESSTLTPAEYDHALDMTTTGFNRFLKLSTISQEEVCDLRKARRRKKNRLYAKRSRGKKLAKLIELQATVSHLSSLTGETPFFPKTPEDRDEQQSTRSVHTLDKPASYSDVPSDAAACRKVADGFTDHVEAQFSPGTLTRIGSY